jgi:hypothetical protein
MPNRIPTSRVQARRRLIEHQHGGVVLQRAGNRHELLDGHRIGAERANDVDVEIEACQTLASPLARPPPGDETVAGRLSLQREVLGHRQRRHEIDLLIDGADTQYPRHRRTVDLHRPAVDADLARVAAEGAGQQLDQRRFAGPVLAQQRMHFAGMEGEVDAAQRQHAGKALRYASQLDPRWRLLGHASAPRFAHCQG